ncbi:MAG TPA: transporter substrate-binding domain-containing protein [Burkholderiales bacterium]|nr:transporter substrate-binding domain-containing protein [Burkholderiales bacterium]
MVRAQTDPDEITDTLERSKAKGKLLACADPYSFPSSAQNSDPPGYDVEIMREIAKRGGMRLEMVWADTGTRGGTSRAFRNSILRKRCDVFLGLSDSGDDDMLMGQLAFTKPYLGMGYVLIVQGRAAGMKTLDELKNASIKVGVPMSTPIDDYLFQHDIPRGLYLDNRRILEGMAKGEIDAALVWGTAISSARREFPNAKFHMVDGYVPEPDQRWNLNFVVRKQDQSLAKFIDESVSELLANGKMKQIIESYDVPFYPPFS